MTDLLMTTSDVARTLTRSAENIRYLTKTGRLKCRRTLTGQRIYRAKDVAQKQIAERDRSRFHWTLDTGLSYTGILPGRDEDMAILGIIYAKHSGAISTTKSHETLVELTYQYQLTHAIYIQPNIQWIGRPSGDNSIDDALVIGLRAGFTF